MHGASVSRMHLSQEPFEPWAAHLDKRVEASGPVFPRPGARPTSSAPVTGAAAPKGIVAFVSWPRSDAASRASAASPIAPKATTSGEPSPKRRPRRLARYPVLLCGLFACVTSMEAFLRSPLAEMPAVRPYVAGVERVLTRGHAGLASGANRAASLVNETLDRFGG